ncbi:M13 family metallopeptidase [Luteibacter sp. SG786]|uniref:M13 family metallopeptidase n=1 Tax=Luteibacter sp. SG786 TaxID=2587130 RepID=UPI0014238830|nr:M13 family metallopeptidase [Luteibacter sp. SG786]NII53985.1 putative endopeptidase [Luteibacter sp. SG786]
MKAIGAAILSTALAFGLARPVAAESATHPQIGPFGFDLAGMDRSVPPGADFYRYANGTWARTTPIPADKPNFGMFTRLDDLNRERVKGILEGARHDAHSKAGVAYAAFLDEAAIERRGLAPARPWLDRIEAIATPADYAQVAAQALREGVAVPFEVNVTQDDRHPDAYVLKLGQAGLGLPDRDYYLETNEAMARMRVAYRDHLSHVLVLAGVDPRDASNRSDAILAMETRIAKASWNRVDTRDAGKTYNRLTRAQATALAKGFDIDTFLRAAGAHAGDVVVSQPSAVAGIAGVVGSTPLPVLKDALRVAVLDAYGDVLPKAFARERFDFHERLLSGAEQPEPRWKRAVAFAVDAVPDEVGKAYVARYFPADHKAAAEALVRNLLAAMDKRIAALDWMTPQTKRRARAKLAAFHPKVGYPEHWQDYSGLDMRADDAFGNRMRARAFVFDRDMRKPGKPFDRDEWRVTPMTVDAFANFSAVEIVIPAAILQPPFFDPEADSAINYGAIGASIAHEITHQFDDQGSKYDEQGRLTTWWTSADLGGFETRTKALARQYDAYEPLPGQHVNGALTLGENIADLGGLAIAYDAWRLSLAGREAPTLEGFTGDQRFFLGWAQIWRLKYRDADLRQRLLTNPHAPAAQRVWTSRNLDAWYEAFDVRPDQSLYLPSNERVRIW